MAGGDPLVRLTTSVSSSHHWKLQSMGGESAEEATPSGVFHLSVGHLPEGIGRIDTPVSAS